MKLYDNKTMVNKYVKDTIYKVLSEKDIKANILKMINDNPNITDEEISDYIYELSQTEEYKIKAKEVKEQLNEELVELLDTTKIHDNINTELFKSINIDIEDNQIFIESDNNVSFILPYPITINEYIITINTIKNYFQLIEEMVFYKNYKEDVEDILKGRNMKHE